MWKMTNHGCLPLLVSKLHLARSALCSMMVLSSYSHRTKSIPQQALRLLVFKHNKTCLTGLSEYTGYFLIFSITGACLAGTGEIGVPPYFAMRLSFPERVTPHNVEQLRQARTALCS